MEEEDLDSERSVVVGGPGGPTALGPVRPCWTRVRRRSAVCAGEDARRLTAWSARTVPAARESAT